MNKKAFSEKDILFWIMIIAGLSLGYVIINALLSSI